MTVSRSEVQKTAKSDVHRYSIVLVCDFSRGLTNRILDVFRFFRQPPHIILARRRGDISVGPGLSVETKVIPIPFVGGLDRGDLTWDHVGRALSCAVGYLVYSFVLYIKVRHSRGTIRLVHAQYIFPQGLFGLLLARLLRVPLIVTAQGLDVDNMRDNAFLRAAYLIVLRRADLTFVVGKHMQRILRQFNISSIYLPNSVDVDSIRPSRQLGNENSILFVGSMIERKQPLVLLRAFERIADQVPTATLVMCGKGNLEDRLRREVEEKRLQKRVKFSYFNGDRAIYNEQPLKDLLSHAGIFVLPSLSEGTSLALLEAMAAGLPVIASRNESHVAMMEHGENGLLFEMGNTEELTKQILLLISDKGLRSRLSKSARYLSETQFSNRIVANQLENFYSSVIARSASTPGVLQ
jgi:glycosyltransferase involved in cell wall biosynthesis